MLYGSDYEEEEEGRKLLSERADRIRNRILDEFGEETDSGDRQIISNAGSCTISRKDLKQLLKIVEDLSFSNQRLLDGNLSADTENLRQEHESDIDRLIGVTQRLQSRIDRQANEIQLLKAQCRKHEEKARCFKALANLSIDFIDLLYRHDSSLRDEAARDPNTFPPLLGRDFRKKENVFKSWIKNWNAGKRD